MKLTQFSDNIGTPCITFQKSVTKELDEKIINK